MSTIKPHRTYSWLDTQAGPIFTCLHRASGEERTENIGVVICYPFAHEYTHSHSTMVAMGDKLATAGFPCIRFDYHGTGDSAGDLTQPGRLETWTANLETAVKHLKRVTGVNKVCLIGLRMGATLAALYSAKAPTDFLILWNPCTQGGAFVRDMQILDQYHSETEVKSDIVELGGFATTEETIAGYKAISLTKSHCGASVNNLLIQKDKQSGNSRLFKTLKERSLPVEEITLPGYDEMMRQPQFSRIANTVIDYCCDWLNRQYKGEEVSPGETPSKDPQQTVPMPGNHTETIVGFGDAGQLFGILTEPAKGDQSVDNRGAIFVISNTGAAHHVGPNRLHVELCRSLADKGIASFRFDLGNLGDSAQEQPDNINHPYPSHALADLTTAVEYLQSKHQYSKFIVGGLCSGANVAFHGSLHLTDVEIAKAILINPLIFYWEEGLSLATPQRQAQQIEKKYYAQSAKSFDKWIKLIKGEVNIKALSSFIFKQIYLSISTLLSDRLEKLGLKPPTRLGKDLIRLQTLDRPLDLFISDSDPGYDIFLAEGRITAKQKLNADFVTATIISNADHTFTTLQSRQDLIREIARRIMPGTTCSAQGKESLTQTAVSDA